MPDLVKSNGVLSLEPLRATPGEEALDGCLHTLAGECSVSVPFIGWYAEQAIIDNMQTFYDNYPPLIADFVTMVVDRWGDGSVRSLRSAVDNMLAEEKVAESEK